MKRIGIVVVGVLAAACGAVEDKASCASSLECPAGQYCAAADLFVLPSILEALPTVAVEALACGTPVVSADNPGGIELHGVFGDDVRVVPREDPGALAAAVLDALSERRRTLPDTATTIQRRFRTEAVAREYWNVYAEVVSAGRS